jgi:hypothetical protein
MGTAMAPPESECDNWYGHGPLRDTVIEDGSGRPSENMAK